jgi:hypothetical protein
MNDMTPVPRHRQAAVTIRSDRALAALKRLARSGRSQAQIIEDALAKAEADVAPRTIEERFEEIAAIVRPAHGMPGKSFKELDDELWDEHGLPR